MCNHYEWSEWETYYYRQQRAVPLEASKIFKELLKLLEGPLHHLFLQIFVLGWNCYIGPFRWVVNRFIFLWLGTSSSISTSWIGHAIVSNRRIFSKSQWFRSTSSLASSHLRCKSLGGLWLWDQTSWLSSVDRILIHNTFAPAYSILSRNMFITSREIR